jgi:purine-binding chemotaxis protein CheW
VPEIRLVVFRLKGAQYAAPIERVREILKPVRFIRMPRAAEWIRGLFNLRGRVLPLIDTAARLGLKRENEFAPKARVVVVDAGGEEVGLVVDEVLEVMHCDSSAVQAPENVMEAPREAFLDGVLDLEGRLVLVLALDSLMAGASEAAAARKP